MHATNATGNATENATGNAAVPAIDRVNGTWYVVQEWDDGEWVTVSEDADQWSAYRTAAERVYTGRSPDCRVCMVLGREVYTG